MVSLIMTIVGIVFIVFGVMFTIAEVKGDFPLFYGFGQDAIGKNAIGIIVVGIALIFFRNGISQTNSIISYGIFLLIELIVIVLYFLLRSKLNKQARNL
ncbi:hypothetical protein, partial [Clostridioides sp. ZZV15-6598]|uniref:hypothetical protein n=1 Tax=Clostridioides sp. ZZV15-6598 TaxID=2811501 RepID=UPI001D10156C|nr:hypothetical protein [Clostridioides sp. ZZV15-6598]